MNQINQLSLDEASLFFLTCPQVDITAHLDVLTISDVHTEVRGDVLEANTVEDMISAFDDIMSPVPRCTGCGHVDDCTMDTPVCIPY